MATLVTNGGKAITANRMIGNGTAPKYMAWGTGAGTSAATDTTLFTEASEARVSGTESRVTTSVTNDTYRVVATITCSGADKTITNAGLWDASSGGTLFFKYDLTPVAIAVGNGLEFTINFQF